MINLDYNSILEIVKSRMSEKRFKHTMAVMKLAVELADVYGESSEWAKWSALLHDITKEQNKNEQLQIIKKSDIITDNVSLQNGRTFHGVTAFLYAKDELGIENVEALNAIRYHTTGRENMSMLEKIIFVADACSYERTYSQVEEIRKLAFENIDEAMLSIMEFTILTVLRRREVIAIDTINSYNYLISEKLERSKS